MFKNNYLVPPPKRQFIKSLKTWWNNFTVLIFRVFSAAEVYVGLDKETEAMACVKEANLLFPHSPDVLFQVRSIYRFTWMR